MILGLVLHEGDAFAHHRPGDDHRGIAGIVHIAPLNPPEGLKDGFEVMPVFEVKRVPKGRDIIGADGLRHDMIRAAADLQMVAVHDAKKIVELILDGKSASFCNLALLLLSISHEHRNSSGIVLELQGKGHAGACGETLTQVPRVPLHSGHAAFHMTGKTGACMPELQDHSVFFDVAEFAQHTVDAGTDMAHAGDETVTFRPAVVAGLVPQGAVEHQNKMQ